MPPFLKAMMFVSVLLLPVGQAAQKLSEPMKIYISKKFEIKDRFEASGKSHVKFVLKAIDSPLNDPRGLDIKELTYEKIVQRDGIAASEVLPQEAFIDYEAMNDFEGLQGRFYRFKFKHGFKALQDKAISPFDIVLHAGRSEKRVYFQVPSENGEVIWNSAEVKWKPYPNEPWYQPVVDACSRLLDWSL